jgi:transcriptional antiterminator
MKNKKLTERKKQIKPEQTCKTVSHSPSKNQWEYKMLMERISILFLNDMKRKDVSLFELASRLEWTPQKLLQWLDGSMARSVEPDKDGTLGEFVRIAAALGSRLEWEIVKNR